jgi:hypothetical protein
MAPGEADALRPGDVVMVVVRPDCVLHHDGRTYGEGETLELKLEDARRLEEQGVVSRPA